jgi:hypothetical protein
LSLPFALVVGVWLMWWLGFNRSIAVAVGFIALAGVAAETGVVMLIYFDQAMTEVKATRAREGRPFTRADLQEAIMLGAVERVRPKMMTVVAIMAGLVPILWSTGAGSEVMQRIAVPMIGGMTSSTILTLVVIPAIYGLIKHGGCRRVRTCLGRWKHWPSGRPPNDGDTMMNGGMMWGVGLLGLLGIIVPVLGAGEISGSEIAAPRSSHIDRRIAGKVPPG